MDPMAISSKKISASWYQHGDVVKIAKELLGKVLCTNIDDRTVKGRIVETEAYSGNNDKACHANNQKMTNRNKVMFDSGGVAYVYLCYGIHHLFNIVTNENGKADAVLIRAVEPLEGIEIMLMRRKMNKIEKRLTAGPGVLSQAFGIDKAAYGASLVGDKVWIEEADPIPDSEIMSSARIGVAYAGEDAEKPWRFYIKENNWVSGK
jgi:DNA-3-methyladenine glycosylase